MKKILISLLLAVLVACNDKPNSDDSSASVIALAGAGSAPTASSGSGSGSGSFTYFSVTSTTPTSNAVSLTNVTSVVVNFDQAMNTSSVQSAFTLNDGTSNITGTFAWSNGNKTVTFSPASQTNWKVHTVTISTSARSANNTASLTGAISFTYRNGPFFQANGLTWMDGTLTQTTGTISSVIMNAGWCNNVPLDKGWCGTTNAGTVCSNLGLRRPTNAEWTDAVNANYPTNWNNIMNGLSGKFCLWTSTNEKACYDYATTNMIQASNYQGYTRGAVRCVL